MERIGDVPYMSSWIFADVPMRLNFGVYLRGKCAPYRKQEARKRSVWTELQYGTSSETLMTYPPAVSSLIKQLSTSSGWKGEREREKRHTQRKTITHKYYDRLIDI